MNAAGSKMAYNARAKASIREFLRSKTWEEKVAAIERMNEASKIARMAMAERRSSLGSPKSGLKKSAEY
jgi:hypothetical protein